MVAALHQIVKHLMAACLLCYFELTEFVQLKMNLIAMIDQIELETCCYFRQLAA